ncbi:hypothetical protein [Streptomyces sp. SID13726]|uniref:hypothetical protein n=1 Tax=Streptomyces sp. SID13726 TaxID=2706058 RepID=UPI0013B8131F|nr:hypothetical protein [Streptomyces sp. SID13726]NEB00634.1 hypothetical protein [Streptomyces sp. SID13726]
MADVPYPYTQVNASYGDMQTVAFVIYGGGDDNGPAGTDLNSVVAVVRTYLESLEGIGGTVASRTDLRNTEIT